MVCDLCGKACTGEGLEIRGARICRSCEQALIAAEVSDPDYPLWIERIKRIWELFLSAPAPLSDEPIT